MAKALKVGSWWNKLDEQQQEAFKRLYFTGRYDINPIRKFLTSAKKRFTNPVYGHFRVEAEGKTWHYSHDRDDFNSYN